MKISIVQYFWLLAIVLAGCLATKTPYSKKVFKDGVNMLYGEISRQELFQEYPGWQQRYADYAPNQAIMDSLRLFQMAGRVEIYLGTWCGDSKREVPRFLKIVDMHHFVSPDSIYMWAVDRDKKLPSGRADARNIQRVATFILYEKEQEIGRIIERPAGDSLEKDILSLMRKK